MLGMLIWQRTDRQIDFLVTSTLMAALTVVITLGKLTELRVSGEIISLSNKSSPTTCQCPRFAAVSVYQVLRGGLRF